MNWRKRTVSNNLDVKGTYIMDMFIRFQENILFINRKYQRKLVWTIDEKQDFINTILNNYPVPIFLLVKYKYENNDFYQYDVIDGLQRLDAIFSFIKNEFPAKNTEGKYCYFNTKALADSDEIIKQEGIIPKIENVLDLTSSRKFLNYELPVSTTEVSDSEVVDIFKRINSTGRKLSKQDLRQAGCVSSFSDLVNKTACKIRGDETSDNIVLFRKMPELSLSNKQLKYKINVFNSFWVKQGILTIGNIRISRDEELIARIYGYILFGESVSPSSDTLNKFYTQGSYYYTKLDELIQEKDETKLIALFLNIYEDIIKIFNSVQSTFSKLIFNDEEVRGKSKIFQVLFLSLYELRKDNYYINDYSAMAKSLKNIGISEFREITNDDEWNFDIRNRNIRRLKSILQKNVVKKLPSKPIREWEIEMERILSAYGIEQQMYDFKLGLTIFKTKAKNNECVSKIVKTLTAMCNTQPDKTGTIIIGIANNKNSALDFKNHYHKNWIEYKQCYLTGVDEEIKRYWDNDAEKYMNFIRNIIEKEPVRSEIKDYILSHINIMEYQDRIFIIITLKNLGFAIAYNNNYYNRHGSNLNNIQVGTPEFDMLVKECMNKNL